MKWLATFGLFQILTLLTGCGSPSASERPADSASDTLQSAQSASNKAQNNPDRINRDTSDALAQSDSISLVGTVVSPKQALISARIPQRIAEVFVRDGQSVDVGQSLLLLDDSDFASQERVASAALITAKSQVERARSGKEAQRVKADSDLKSAKSGLATAKMKLSQATLGRQASEDDQKADLKTASSNVSKAELALERSKKTLADLEELSKAGGVSRSNLEDAHSQMKNAQLDFNAANSQVLKLKSGRNGVPYRVLNSQSEVETAASGVIQAKEAVSIAEKGFARLTDVADAETKTANSGVLQAEAGLKAAQTARSQSRLLSPVSGIVVNLLAHAGETAQPGATLLSVVSLKNLHAEALVSARLLPSVIVGKSVSIVVDTLPGKKFAALVSEIAQTAELDGRTFRVKFRFVSTPALRPGQTARITITPGK